MTPLPKEPSGSSSLVQCVRIIIRCLRERTLLADPSVRPQWGANGFTINAVAGAASGKQAPVNAGMVFRGEWDPSVTYVPGDVVVVRNGASSGSYVCVIKNTGEAPSHPLTGESWVNLSPGNILGVWL